MHIAGSGCCLTNLEAPIYPFQCFLFLNVNVNNPNMHATVEPDHFNIGRKDPSIHSQMQCHSLVDEGDCGA